MSSRVAPHSDRKGHHGSKPEPRSFRGASKQATMDHELTIAIMHKQSMDDPSMVILFEILLLYIQQFTLISKLDVPWSSRWLRVVKWFRLMLFDFSLSTDTMKLINLAFVLITPLFLLRMVDARFRLAQNDRSRENMEIAMAQPFGMLRPLVVRLILWLVPQAGLIVAYVKWQDENIAVASAVWLVVGLFPFRILWKRSQFYLKCNKIGANMTMFWTNVLRAEHNTITLALLGSFMPVTFSLFTAIREGSFVLQSIAMVLLISHVFFPIYFIMINVRSLLASEDFVPTDKDEYDVWVIKKQTPPTIKEFPRAALYALILPFELHFHWCRCFLLFEQVLLVAVVVFVDGIDAAYVVFALQVVMFCWSLRDRPYKHDNEDIMDLVVRCNNMILSLTAVFLTWGHTIQPFADLAEVLCICAPIFPLCYFLFLVGPQHLCSQSSGLQDDSILKARAAQRTKEFIEHIDLDDFKAEEIKFWKPVQVHWLCVHHRHFLNTPELINSLSHDWGLPAPRLMDLTKKKFTEMDTSVLGHALHTEPMEDVRMVKLSDSFTIDLQRIRTAAQLDFSGSNLTVNDAILVLTLLERNRKQLASLEIPNSNVSLEAMNALSRAIDKGGLRRLTNLNLKGNGIAGLLVDATGLTGSFNPEPLAKLLKAMKRAEISEGREENASVATKFHIGLQLKTLNLSSVVLSGRQNPFDPAKFEALSNVVRSLPASILNLDLSGNVLSDDGMEVIHLGLKAVEHSKSEIVCGKADRDDGPVLGKWDSPNPPKIWHGDKMPDESSKRAQRIAFAKKHCLNAKTGDCVVLLHGKVDDATILAATRKFILAAMAKERESSFVVAMAYQHKGFSMNASFQGAEWYPTFNNSLVGAIIAVRQKQGWWKEGQVIRFDGKKGVHQVKYQEDNTVTMFKMGEIDFCICETDIPIKMRLTSVGCLPALLKLDLSHNFIGPQGTRTLTTIIQESLPLLQQLNLASNNLGCEGAKILSEFFLEIDDGLGLQEFDIRQNDITLEGGAALAQVLFDMKTLNLICGVCVDPNEEPFALDLSGKRHCVGTLRIISQFFGGANQRECMDELKYFVKSRVSKRCIHCRGELEDHSRIGGLAALTSLDLTGLKIGVNGVRLLVRILKCREVPLQSINIVGNDLGDSGKLELANYFLSIDREERGLRLRKFICDEFSWQVEDSELDVSHRGLGSVDAKLLAGVLNVASSVNHLKYLRLSDNDLGELELGEGWSVREERGVVSYQHEDEDTSMFHHPGAPAGIATLMSTIASLTFPNLMTVDFRKNNLGRFVMPSGWKEVEFFVAGEVTPRKKYVRTLADGTRDEQRLHPGGPRAMEHAVKAFYTKESGVPNLKMLKFTLDNFDIDFDLKNSTLELKERRLNQSSAAQLASFISNSGRCFHLKTLRLVRCGLGGWNQQFGKKCNYQVELITRISESLLTHKMALEVIDLRRNKLGKNGAIIFGKVVKQMEGLNHVGLSEAEIKIGTTDLNLSGLDIGYQGLSEIAGFIHSGATEERIVHLNLSNNNLTGSSEIDDLDLEAPFFDPLGIYHLAETMKMGRLPHLQSLVLSKNNFSGEGQEDCLRRFCDGMNAVSRTLTHLDMSSTGLGPDGMQILMDAIDSESTSYDLQQLYLADNDFGVNGASLLASVIKKGNLDNVRVLDICNNSLCGVDSTGAGVVDTKGLVELCEAILGHSHSATTTNKHWLRRLRSLFLAGNSITGKAMDILSDALDCRGHQEIEKFTEFESDVCTVLPDSSCLTLANEGLGPVEAKFLGACLLCVKVDHLQELDLSNNNLCGYDPNARESFQMDNFLYFCDVLKKVQPASLTSLNLSHNTISSHGTQALADVFHSGALLRLESLGLENVGMIPMMQKFGAAKLAADYSGISALWESLDREELPVLQTLSIAGNDATNTKAVLEQIVETTSRLRINFKS